MTHTAAWLVGLPSRLEVFVNWLLLGITCVLGAYLVYELTKKPGPPKQP